MLIAYFSWDDEGYTQPEKKIGFTHRVADEIALVTGAQEFEIKPVTLYPEDYESTKDIVVKEIESQARPKIRGPLPNIAQHETVFLGYPIWCGEPPMAVHTFLEASGNLAGKTVIPFSTNGSSGWANSLDVLKISCPKALFRNGFQVSQDKVGESMPAIDRWLNGLGYGR